MGLESLEFYQLKSALDFAVKTFRNLLLDSLVKGTDRLILLGSRVSHKVPLASS